MTDWRPLGSVVEKIVEETRRKMKERERIKRESAVAKIVSESQRLELP